MTIKNKLFSITAMAFAVQSSIAYADAEFERRVEERLAALEGKAPSQTSGWSDKVALSGLIEIEAAIGEEFDDQSYSSLTVATVELGLAAQISKQVAAEIVLLYEEGDTPLDVDVATLRFDKLIGPVDLLIGKQYLPFGRFETALVNDTLILELAETNKTAALFGIEQDALNLGVFLFDGDVDRAEHVENWGLTFTFAQDNFSVGADYISSLAESDALSEELGEFYVDDDGAFTLSGKIDLDEVTILGEYLTALDDIEYQDGLAIAKAEPSAIQVEVDIAAQINDKAWSFGFAVQQTDDAAGWLPEQRLSLGGSTEIYDGVGLGLEFWHDVDYDTNDGGTGEKANNVVLQLAAEF